MDIGPKLIVFVLLCRGGTVITDTIPCIGRGGSLIPIGSIGIARIPRIHSIDIASSCGAVRQHAEIRVAVPSLRVGLLCCAEQFCCRMRCVPKGIVRAGTGILVPR